MYTIFLWIFISILDAVWMWNYKKSINESNLTLRLFKIFAGIFWWLFLITLIFIFGFDLDFLINLNDMLLLLFAATLSVWANLLELSILKNIKLSNLMPFENLDKIFIIIIWFFLFYGTEKETSIATLCITLFTILFIWFFTINLKDLKLPKNFSWIFLYKIIKAIVVLIFWFLLIKYSTYTLAFVNWGYATTLLLIMSFIYKDSFITMIRQSKQFYINRMTATILGNISYIIGLFIIQSSGIIIATLLWFLWMVFNILSMKYFLNDIPTRKQVFLAFSILILITLWIYLNN